MSGHQRAGPAACSYKCSRREREKRQPVRVRVSLWRHNSVVLFSAKLHVLSIRLRAPSGFCVCKASHPGTPLWRRFLPGTVLHAFQLSLSSVGNAGINRSRPRSRTEQSLEFSFMVRSALRVTSTFDQLKHQRIHKSCGDSEDFGSATKVTVVPYRSAGMRAFT